MAGHSRPKDGVASIAYVPAIPLRDALCQPKRDTRHKAGYDNGEAAALPRNFLPAEAANGRLAAAVGELRGIVRAGALPGIAVAGERRARATGDMRGNPSRKYNIGFERDADDLLVAGRRYVEARQLAPGVADRGGFLGARTFLRLRRRCGKARGSERAQQARAPRQAPRGR